MLLLIALSLPTTNAQNSKKQQKNRQHTAPAIRSTTDSVSLALGKLIGNDLLHYIESLPEENINIDLFLDEFQKTLKKDTLNTFFTLNDAGHFFELQMTAAAEKQNERRKSENADFLGQNAKRPEVTVTETGLQYEIITLGDGQKPTSNSVVTVDYEGSLIDGTVFDSSLERGEPISFGLNQVIRGWTEGLQLMPIGSEFKFYIPSQLGYGDRAAGDKIPASSTLIFYVKLLDIAE
ncbi:MAG: FKBP-type peptidyl-prolyl cis-trans isomerase [Prevotellaceae bacterium]|nr:FKBP-type peptidyl-prolyl cis-trans isomerase [Prevotellaceae bacterium]